MGFYRNPNTGHVYGFRENGDISFSTEDKMPAMLQAVNKTGIVVTFPDEFSVTKVYNQYSNYWYTTACSGVNDSKTYDLGAYTAGALPTFSILNVKSSVRTEPLLRVGSAVVIHESHLVPEIGVGICGTIPLVRIQSGNKGYVSIIGNVKVVADRIKLVVDRAIAAFSWTDDIDESDMANNRSTLDVTLSLNGYLCRWIG